MNFNFAVEWACETAARQAADDSVTPSRLTLAEVPRVDHRIGQEFEGIMQLAYALKPKQQVTDLIVPAKHPLGGIEPQPATRLAAVRHRHCPGCSAAAFRSQ
jgi:hypothetical protein